MFSLHPSYFASLVTILHVVWTGPSCRNGAWCVSSVCVCIYYWPLRRKHLPVSHLRHPVLNPQLTSQIDDGVLSQYYVIFTGTILFYNYFLTLSSEVCWNCPSSTSGVRPDVTTLVTGNTGQRVTQTHNCTATSDRREGTKLWFNAKEKTGDKWSIGFLHNST